MISPDFMRTNEQPPPREKTTPLVVLLPFSIVAAYLFFTLFLIDLPLPPMLQQDFIEKVWAAGPWRVLLPMDFGGYSRWTFSGLVPIAGLNALVSPSGTFLVLGSALIFAAYFASWAAFRSVVFSTTMALLMAFGSQFDYTYANNACLVFYPLLIYAVLNLAAFHRLLTAGPKIAAAVFFTATLVLVLGCWEQSLDYVGFVLAACGFLYLRAKKLGLRDLPADRGGKFVFFVTLGLVLAYLLVRLQYAGEHVKPGHEAETVLTYPSAVVAIEDVISNVFTYLFIAFSNFLPAFLSFANSLHLFTAENLLVFQNGYRVGAHQFVVMHYIFYWYFLAGIVFVCYARALARTGGRALKTADPEPALIFLFLLLVACGGFTHLWIKFRSYLSVPLLTYKCIVSVLGVALLVSYLLMVARKKIGAWWKYALLVAAVWLIIVFNAFTRPYAEDKWQQIVGLGPFPADPVGKLQGIVSGQK